MAEKNYVKGNAKEFVFQDGGSVLNISIDCQNIDKTKLVKDRYLNISIGKRKEVGQYGDTHTMIYNEYKPKAESQGEFNHGNEPKDDELPF